MAKRPLKFKESWEGRIFIKCFCRRLARYLLWRSHPVETAFSTSAFVEFICPHDFDNSLHLWRKSRLRTSSALRLLRSSSFPSLSSSGSVLRHFLLRPLTVSNGACPCNSLSANVRSITTLSGAVDDTAVGLAGCGAAEGCSRNGFLRIVGLVRVLGGHDDAVSGRIGLDANGLPSE